MTDPGRQEPSYRPPPPDGRDAKYLVAVPAHENSEKYPFFAKLEIGRDDEKRRGEPGVLLLPDPTVSRLHCVVTQRADGRCSVRDVSRNGTRLDGRRLVPNVEAEWQVGHVIAVGSREFVLAGDQSASTVASHGESISTIPLTNRTIATVLVGDIRDYTVLVRTSLSEELQRAVTRVFEVLSAAVLDHGGTVKEYQGDAILAFWEGDVQGKQAAAACRAALLLDGIARQIGADRSVWPFADVPLHLDWALATGLVLIDSFGRGQPTGLSMMGEPVVRAFRIEKFATDHTGRIVTCSMTRQMAGDRFLFRDLGEKLAKGFDRPDHVFALSGPSS